MVASSRGVAVSASDTADGGHGCVGLDVRYDGRGGACCAR
jgi:hypothetical protein